MAIRLRQNLAVRRSIHLRRFSTSPPRPPPPPPPEKKDEEEPFSSLFSEIKARLKQPAPPRRIPLSPPNPTADQAAPSHPTDKKPPPSFSFQDLYKSNVLDKSAEDRPSFESIRESLRQLRAAQPSTAAPARLGHPLDLKSLTNRLNLRAEPAGPLPDSIFGRELQEKKPEEGKKTEFLKTYDFEELGEKLRKLRPDEALSEKKDWFSLEELNERLAKLRELEERETEYSIGGVSFKDLRESLVKLRDADNKKASMNKFSILANLGGQVTPAFMLNPPKENLVEKYFHPDHLSAAEKLELELKKVRDEFKMSESDCGSTRVQVAQLTTRIRYLEPILYTKKKGKGLKGPDKHSIKGMVAMVKRRNKLLKYLRRTDWESYCMTLTKLGIRDIEKKEAKGGKGSKEKKRGKKGVGKHSKAANYAT